MFRLPAKLLFCFGFPRILGSGSLGFSKCCSIINKFDIGGWKVSNVGRSLSLNVAFTPFFVGKIYYQHDVTDSYTNCILFPALVVLQNLCTQRRRAPAAVRDD